MALSFTKHKVFRYLHLNIQGSLSFFCLRNDERSLLVKLQKGKTRNREHQQSQTFLYSPVVHLNVSPEAFSPPPLPPPYCTPSTFHHHHHWRLPPMGALPPSIPSHCHIFDSTFTHFGKQKTCNFQPLSFFVTAYK